MNKLKQEEVEKNGKKYLRTVCLIYSRVCGYIQNIANYNPGKLSEYHDRVMMNVEEYRKNEKK